MSKPTPGPWRVEPMVAYGRDIYAGDIWIGQANNNHDYPPGDFPTNEECDANARLIATAPDLLEALEDMTARFERCCRYNGNADEEMLAESTKDAHAAIAKAKGE